MVSGGPGTGKTLLAIIQGQTRKIGARRIVIDAIDVLLRIYDDARREDDRDCPSWRMREIVMSARAEKGRGKNKRSGTGKGAQYNLRLFVAGNEPNSVLARTSLARICSEHLEGHCDVEIIDVLKDLQPALQEGILVTPALVIRHQQVRSVIFGNLTNIDRVLAALDVGSEPS